MTSPELERDQPDASWPASVDQPGAELTRAGLTRADPPTTPALGASRARVLEALQQANVPVAISDVATTVGLHQNTARFHLDALVELGLASRTTEDRQRPGRPRALYRATDDAQSAGRRSYRLLAEILTSYLAAHSRDPAKSALRAGEAWGRFFADRPGPFRRVDADEATRQLIDVLDDIGFAPEAVADDGHPQVLLRHCPFREVAEEHRDVVCAIHLGLMRGVLNEIEAPLAATRLEAFVEPNLCVADLAPRPAGNPRHDVRRSSPPR